MVVFRHFSFKRKVAKLFFCLFYGKTFQFDRDFPVVNIEHFIVKRKLRIEVGSLKPVKNLAVFFLVVRQPFGRGIDPKVTHLEPFKIGQII